MRIEAGTEIGPWLIARDADGRELRDLLMVDTDEGLMSRAVRGEDGRVTFDADGVLMATIIRAPVTIEARHNAPQWVKDALERGDVP